MYKRYLVIYLDDSSIYYEGDRPSLEVDSYDTLAEAKNAVKVMYPSHIIDMESREGIQTY